MIYVYSIHISSIYICIIHILLRILLRRPAPTVGRGAAAAAQMAGASDGQLGFRV